MTQTIAGMSKQNIQYYINLGVVVSYVFFIYSGALKWLTIFPIDAAIFFAINSLDSEIAA